MNDGGVEISLSLRGTPGEKHDIYRGLADNELLELGRQELLVVRDDAAGHGFTPEFSNGIEQHALIRVIDLPDGNLGSRSHYLITGRHHRYLRLCHYLQLGRTDCGQQPGLMRCQTGAPTNNGLSPANVRPGVRDVGSRDQRADHLNPVG